MVLVVAVAGWFTPGLIVRPGSGTTTSCVRLLDQGTPLPQSARMEQEPALRTNHVLQTVTCTWHDADGLPTLHRSYPLWTTSAATFIVLTAASSAGVVLWTCRRREIERRQ